MHRNKLGVCLHFVWRTWDRLPLIEKEIQRELYRNISAVCEEKHCKVLAIGGMPDHVHLFVLMSATISIADLIMNVKGASSRYVTAHLKPGETFAWQRHYGAFSVSGGHKARLIDYIKNQERHHAQNTILASAEESEEDVPPNE